MSARERDLARDALVQRVAEITAAPPSLPALYSLAPQLEYADDVLSAHEIIRLRLRHLDVERAWLAELRQPIPDPTLWIRWDRSPGLKDALEEGAHAWRARPPDRFFGPHSRVVGPPSDIAVLHLSLLQDLDPVAAIEYAASLPGERLVWAAAWLLKLGTLPDLVATAVADGSRDAALLALSCTFEALCEERLSYTTDTSPRELDVAAVRQLEIKLEPRLQRLASLTAERSDGGAVLGPWLRHLVRTADRLRFREDDPRKAVALLAADAAHSVIKASPRSVDVVPYPERDAACLVSRILIDDAKGVLNEERWNEWRELLVSEHRSLSGCRDFAWARAGDALAHTATPADAWLETSLALLPYQRRLERGDHDRTVDLLTHLLVPAIHASAARRDTRLWREAYSLSRRHFLVSMPLPDQVGYKLPAFMFAAFPKAFGGDTSKLKAALGQLPSAEHRAWAAEHLSKNSEPTEQGEGDAQRVASSDDAEGRSPESKPAETSDSDSRAQLTHLSHRLVGFFDILGFSNRLETTPLADLHALYAALIDEARSTVFSSVDLANPSTAPRPNFDRAQFLFDSLVVVSHPLDTPGAGPRLFNFFAALVDLMEKSFAMCLPLRGAIGLGDYAEDAGRAIFLSQVFPSIVAAEKAQEWTGCFLQPDAADVSIQGLYGSNEGTSTEPYAERERLLIHYPVPMKSGEPAARWCLNWVHLLSDNDLAKGIAFLRGAKRGNTQAFVEHVLRLPATDAALPANFLPATQIRKQITPWGVRIKFCDPAGRGVDPPDGAKIGLRIAVKKTD